MEMVTLHIFLKLLSVSPLRVWPVWRVWLLSSEQGSPRSVPQCSYWQGEQGHFLHGLRAFHGRMALGSSLKEQVGLSAWRASWWPSPALDAHRWTLFKLIVWEGISDSRDGPAQWQLRESSPFCGAKVWDNYLTRLILILLCIQVIIIKNHQEYKI